MSLGTDFGLIWPHAQMLRDKVRNDAYACAIRSSVKDGDVVVEVGAGTAFLSVLCARAGARAVYAIERAPIARIARQIVDANGCGSVVNVIEADACECALPESCDIIVSELFGGYGIDENFLDAFAIVRERWLRPGGLVLPNILRVFCAPVFESVLRGQMAYWAARPYGIDLSPIARSFERQVFYGAHHLREHDLLARPEVLWEIDLSTAKPESLSASYHGDATFDILLEAKANAICIWFDIEFPSSNHLSNGPGAARTHWGPTLLPLEEEIVVAPGQRLHFHMSHFQRESGRSAAVWQTFVD